MGVPESEFPSIGVGKLVKVRELRRGLSAQFAKNSKPVLLTDWVTALQVGTLQRTKTWGPSAFLWEGWSRCAHHRGQLSVWEPCRRQDSSGGWSRCTQDQATVLSAGPRKVQKCVTLCLPPGWSVWELTTGVCRVRHTQKWRPFIPEGLRKREDLDLLALGLEIQARPFLFWSSKEAQGTKATQSNCKTLALGENSI